MGFVLLNVCHSSEMMNLHIFGHFLLCIVITWMEKRIARNDLNKRAKCKGNYRSKQGKHKYGSEENYKKVRLRCSGDLDLG